MIIERNLIQQMTIEEFAEANGLVMEIHERSLPVGHDSRYYASFKDCDVKGDGVLIGTFGNGATPEAAILAYAHEISLCRIVIGAFKEDRREIAVPRLVDEESNAI